MLSNLGRIMTTKDIHNLISQTYEHVTLCSKRDLADVIKFIHLEMGKLSWNIHTGFTYLGGPFLVGSERDMSTGERSERCDVSLAGFEDGGRGLRSKEGSDPWKPGMALSL